MEAQGLAIAVQWSQSGSSIARRRKLLGWRVGEAGESEE